MAVKTPATTGEGRFGPTQLRVGALASTETYSANGRVLHIGSKPSGALDGDYDDRYADGTGDIVANRVGWVRKYFSDIDDTDTWNTGYHGVFLALWQPDDVDADFVSPYVKNGTGELRKGIVEFQTAAAATDLSGWVWILIDRDLNPTAPFINFGN